MERPGRGESECRREETTRKWKDWEDTDRQKMSGY
jgi:hypothetical protein